MVNAIAQVKPLLRGPLQGQNTTCFAFGPTGAGMYAYILAEL